MAPPPPVPLDGRVLILAPTPVDAAMCRSVLGEAGLPHAVCPDLGALVAEIERGASAVLLTDQSFARDDPRPLVQALGRQPPWSDLPILLLCGNGADAPLATWAQEVLVNVTILERPVRMSTLVSALRAAVRARERQYELREADRRKDEFLATLSHELRNPLAPLRNCLHLLRHGSPPPASLPTLYEVMERQVDLLVRLVDDLLELSRVTRGTLSLRVERVRLADVVYGAVETSEPAVSARRHRLTVALPREAAWLNGDRVRLAQILANLLNNAATYTEPGGQIGVEGRVEDGHAVVAVRDNGSGISPDALPHVFDMFSRGDRAERRGEVGLGIGLGIARRLAQMHGGTLTARSEGLGRGSEFVLRLPLAEAEAAEPHAPKTGDSAAPAGRILVVDDNRDAADSLRMVLEALGADVRVAHDGPGALALFQSYEPAIVLLDIGMPGMDGYEVARRIRASGPGRPTLLVALTGWGQEDDRRNAEAAGFDHHMVKPADLGALRLLLAAAEGTTPAAPRLPS